MIIITLKILKYTFNKYIQFTLIAILIISSITVSAQDSLHIMKRSDNEGTLGLWFIPHEIKYGGITDFKRYRSQFYAAYYIFGIKTGQGDGTINHLSAGVSYSKMFKKDYISLFPYYGRTGWWGGHYGVKVEPLINLQNKKIQYTNLEFTFGFIASLSVCVYIPSNQASNPFYAGFKIGYAIPFPVYLKE